MNKLNLYSKKELFQKMLVILNNYDQDTAKHSLRVGLYTSLFLNYLKEINKLELISEYSEYLKDLIFAAAIHDIGKIYLKPRIIKEGEIYNADDIEEIKEHPKIGALFFDPLEYKVIYEGVLYHHERYDGNGYPFKLKDTNISLVGRIINITDSFDAMTSQRPYIEHVKNPDDSLIEIKKGLKEQFDPQLGKYFIKMFNNPKYSNLLKAPKDSPEIIEALKKLVLWLESDNQKLPMLF